MRDYEKVFDIEVGYSAEAEAIQQYFTLSADGELNAVPIDSNYPLGYNSETMKWNYPLLTTNSEITEIVIADIFPDREVKSIGFGCFVNCVNITSITVPDSVTSFANNVFQNMTKLTSINIPNIVTSIGDACFNGCTSITSIEIPSGVTSLSAFCFGTCTKLSSISVPDTVTSIGNSCFNGCQSLREFTMPSSITTLGNACFSTSVFGYGASSSNPYVLPEGLKTIGDECFLHSSLYGVSVPSTVTSIGTDAFKLYAGYSYIIINKTSGSISGSPWGSVASNVVWS